MMQQRHNQRLTYIGGGVTAAQWIPAGVDWWNPGGSFTCVAAYAPKGAASLAASYVNLANPGTYNAAPGVAPTFDTATGWTFNGSTQYLTTGYVPYPTQPNGGPFSIIVRFAGAANTGGLAGVRFTSTLKLAIHPADTTGLTYWMQNALTVSPAITGGVVAITQGAALSSTGTGYRNGASDTNSGTVAASNPRVITIGGISTSATGTSIELPFAGNIQAVAIYSTTLDATQVATLSAAMAAL